MRLSFAGSWMSIASGTGIRRNRISRHRIDGGAVGDPRLVNPPDGGLNREGVVIRHNGLTE